MTPDERTRATASGLARWRARQAEEKRLRMAELDALRRFATTEVREGRTWSVVRIPDRYDEAWRRVA